MQFKKYETEKSKNNFHYTKEKQEAFLHIKIFTSKNQKPII